LKKIADHKKNGKIFAKSKKTSIFASLLKK